MQGSFRLLLVFFLLPVFVCSSQTDLNALLDEEKPTVKKVYATFKTAKLANAQTIEQVKKKHLDFRISHRFGNVYDATNSNPVNESFQTFLGFDNASDIRLGFDYGLSDRIALGIGRSKYNRLLDANIKCRLLTQTSDFKIPVTVVFYGSAGYTHLPVNLLYGGLAKDFPTRELHRLNYLSQLIIASRLSSRLSVEVLPGYYHRNFIRERFNTENNTADQNGFFTVGFGARMKLSKRVSVIADYFYNFASYYRKNTLVHQPLSLGVEIETGGHVFSFYYTNAEALVDNNFLSGTGDSWRKGQIKFGFSISRTFAL